MKMTRHKFLRKDKTSPQTLLPHRQIKPLQFRMDYSKLLNTKNAKLVLVFFMSGKSGLILFLLMAVPSLAFVPWGTGQSYTTITSLKTNTTQATFTQESRHPVTTVSGTSMFTDTIYDSSFVLKGTGKLFCWIASPISFDALKGQNLQVNITSSNPNSLTIYILSNQQYKIWSSSNKCAPTDAGTSALVSAGEGYENHITSYALNWTVPADGTYSLLVENFYGKDSTITAAVFRHYTQQVASAVYSTQTSLAVLTATRTASSAYTEEIANPSLPVNTLVLVAVGIVVLVALGASYLVLSRRRKKR